MPRVSVAASGRQSDSDACQVRLRRRVAETEKGRRVPAFEISERVLQETECEILQMLSKPSLCHVLSKV